VEAAWEVLKTMPKFIKRSFVSSGWLLAKDGSENHLVKLKKYMKEYTLPHPADTPVESGDESDGSDESE
jgi:hypothetical protein